MAGNGGRGGKSRARPRHRNRVSYSLREFLLVPLVVAGLLIVLAVIASVLDRSAQHWAWPMYQAVSTVVPAEVTTTFLSTVTPGLLTVISIIFFVLLMAVQHQSATYSPVVLDQFLRRKLNQVFFGLFVGLTVYCLLALALVPSGAIMAGTLALLLTTITLVCLLVFVYSTVDQIRPSATVWMLQQLAGQARAGQQPLLARCRAQAQLTDVPTTEVTAGQAGYVVHINGDLLAHALHPVSDTAEIELQVAMGEHVVSGGVLAKVRADDQAERNRLAEAVLDALWLGRMRDLGRDAAHSVDHLSNMAWAATATSADPEGARITVETLHSLLITFQEQESQHSAGSHGGPLPLVYNDPVIGKVLDGLTSVIAASGQSGQHQTCGAVITVLSRALPQLEPDNQHIAFDRLQRVLPTALNHVFTFEMEHAFDAMQQAMYETELPDGAKRIRQIKEQMRENQLLADPAEE
ncbi:DUF2254 family protein [Parasphingorhabdus pacifica]